MYTDQIPCADALQRLRRVHGQLGGLIRMIEEGRDCTEALTLLAAINHALHRAEYSLVAAALAQCASDPDRFDAQRLEKLFVALG